MSSDIKLQISGNNKVVAKNGIYTFSRLKFVAAPDYHSSIKYTSNAMDLKKISLVSQKQTSADL